ncbi:MAG TPA: hypothetical protein PK264_01855 [Hyphomicrobiaceae bacterium]|nr:hypothetical protein [Hyphomicrobiaceae bacterium]
MIVTHTQNATGQRRVYLGAKASLECWIEPKADGTWSFHIADAVAGIELGDATRRTSAIHTLAALADELAVAPADLAAVPFEVIAALHTASPYANRRVPLPRRTPIENSFMATSPGITRPSADFRARDFGGFRRPR